MLGFDPRAARATWTAVAVLLLLWTLFQIREPIFILIIAVLFAYMLAPVVNIINRLLPNKSRAPGLAITYLLLVVVLAVLGTEIGGRVVAEASSLAASAPKFLQNLQNSSSSLPLPGYLTFLRGNGMVNVQTFFKEHSNEVVGSLSTAGIKVLSYSSYLLFVVLVPIISFFLLKDASELRSNIVSLLGDGPRRDMWIHIMEDTNTLLGQYVLAVGLLCLTTFVVFAIALSILGVPYAILLAAIAFPLEFIPLVGPLTAAVVIIVVSLASGYPHVLWIVLFLGIYRVIQDYVISPRLMSEGVEVHPLLVILGVLAGEKLGGVPGMFLSVPVIALLRVLYRRLTTANRIHDRIIT